MIAAVLDVYSDESIEDVNECEIERVWFKAVEVWSLVERCCPKGPCNVARIPKPRGPADGSWAEKKMCNSKSYGSELKVGV